MGLAYHPFRVEEALHPFRVVAALHLTLMAAVMLLQVEVALEAYQGVQALPQGVVEQRPCLEERRLVVQEEVESQLEVPLALQVLEFAQLLEQEVFLPA